MSSNSICNHTRDKNNRTLAARSSDFVITRVITGRIEPHYVLSPLQRDGVFKFPRFQERFRVGSLWTVDLTIELKVRFTNVFYAV